MSYLVTEPPPQKAKYELVVYTRKQSEVFELLPGAILAVGRGPENAVRIDDASVSRSHARIYVNDEVDVEGGVGKVVLDFAGAWTSSSAVAVKMAVGELTLRLPRRVGIRLTLDKFLASFDPAGLVERDGAYESAGYAEAERKLDIAVTSAVGGVKIAWVE